MEGVKAFSEDGTDLTDQVTAVLTGNGTQTNKVVRYSVFDENGQETTKRRDLKFVNYKGPSISVEEQLELKAENMQNLTAYLKEEGMLVGED